MSLRIHILPVRISTRVIVCERVGRILVKAMNRKGSEMWRIIETNMEREREKERKKSDKTKMVKRLEM